MLSIWKRGEGVDEDKFCEREEREGKRGKDEEKIEGKREIMVKLLETVK